MSYRYKYPPIFISNLEVNTDKDWKGYKIKNLGAPVDPNDAVRITDVPTYSPKPSWLLEVISPESYTIPVPSGAKYVFAILVGGGGGGGGVYGSSPPTGGGGGGGGGGTKYVLASVSGLSSISLTVGAGGDRGRGYLTGPNGQDGGNTTLTIGNTTYTAYGGKGGGGTLGSSGGAGGAGGAGDIPGGAGGSGGSKGNSGSSGQSVYGRSGGSGGTGNAAGGGGGGGGASAFGCGGNGGNSGYGGSSPPTDYRMPFGAGGGGAGGTNINGGRLDGENGGPGYALIVFLV